MKYLTIEQVIAIHDYAIREFGGSPEIGSAARLESGQGYLACSSF